MAVQIGKIIKQVMEEKNVTASELAARIGKHPGSLSRIFNYRHMHTSLLQKFSQALGHDFFKYFTQDIRVERPEAEKQLELLRKEMEDIRKENGYLKQINDLLKQDADKRST